MRNSRWIWVLVGTLWILGCTGPEADQAGDDRPGDEDPALVMGVKAGPAAAAAGAEWRVYRDAKLGFKVLYPRALKVRRLARRVAEGTTVVAEWRRKGTRASVLLPLGKPA